MCKVITIFRNKKKVVIAKVYQSIILLAKGLRFSKPLKKNEALLLASSREDLQTIDMLFVFFSIDAVWLDKDKRVIHIVRNIKPFTIAISSPKRAQYILECLANYTAALKRNDRLS